MADIEWSDVLAFAPELSGVDSAAQTTILGYVNKLKASVFGGADSDEYKLARIYLAAHMGTAAIPGEGSITGQVTAESAGGLSRSYAVASSSSAALGGNTDYDLTGYGKKFKAMLLRSGARGGFAV